MRIKTLAIVIFCSGLICSTVYYCYPIERIPRTISIDKIVVLKSKRTLYAYSNGQMIVSYKVALGKNPAGTKEYEGDERTPEGSYIINSKNPASEFHKNLGISYPNSQDIKRAKQLSKLPGGDIKIHGLRNGQGFFGRFQSWRDWTNGCIALTDQEIDELYEHTPIGTLIEIEN